MIPPSLHKITTVNNSVLHPAMATTVSKIGQAGPSSGVGMPGSMLKKSPLPLPPIPPFHAKPAEPASARQGLNLFGNMNMSKNVALAAAQLIAKTAKGNITMRRLKKLIFQIRFLVIFTNFNNEGDSRVGFDI